MSIFGAFLMQNSVKLSKGLPIVQTLEAYHLDVLVEQNCLGAKKCDVFEGENLNYFFVGRPAYKFAPTETQSQLWEYPCCFIFDFSDDTSFKRIFPFDSGAFAAKMYPPYIQMMKLESFDVAEVPDASRKIIGAFFANSYEYCRGKPKSGLEFAKEYPKETSAEVSALQLLYNETGITIVDDRRFTVEVQIGQEVEFGSKAPVAVVVPMDYLENNAFMERAQQDWGAKIISYPIYSLNRDNVYGQIYERVYAFYQLSGYL